MNHVRLDEVADVTKLAGFEFTKYIKYVPKGEIIAIRALNLRNGRLDLSDVQRIERSVSDSLPRSQLHRFDIVLSYTGTIGESAQIIEEGKYHLAPNVAKVTPDVEKIDPLYLFQYIRSKEFKQKMMSYAHGSTQPTIPMRAIRELMIPTFDVGIEKKIGEMLSLIDDKIDTNTKINDNLLQQADLLFKSWFLDYAPWGGNIPESWISGKLGEYTEIKRGGSPRPIQEYLSDSGLRWLKISDVTSLSSPFVIDIKDHIIESGLRKTVLLSAGSLVLSNSATPGIPKILDVDSCIHDGWLYFPKSVFSKEFLYLYFRYIRQHLVNLSNGSVFNNLKTDILKEYPTTLPDSETLHQFDETVKPMFDRMQGCARESHMLAELRDALLPRLMSGEIDVSSITI